VNKLLLVLLTSLVLQACAVNKIDPNSLSPNSQVKSSLPFKASLFVYIPAAEAHETLVMRYGYGNEHVFKTGEFLKQAAMDVAAKYFEDVKELSLSEKTHYVLKLEGDSDVDVVWGVYTGEVKAKLYKASGELVHEALIKDTTVSGIIIDDNAVYNSYAKALVKVFDEIALNKKEGIQSHIASASAQTVNLSDSENTPLDLASTGSGFLVSNTGSIVTNHHVVNSCLTVSIALDGKEYKAKVKQVNEDLDLAVLDSELISNHFANIVPTSSRVRLGEDVIAMGYPLHGVLSSSPSLTTGNISALKGIQDDENSLQFTAPIQSGNSGGPLINKSGGVIGVIQSKLNAIKLARFTGDIAQNVNFAVNGKQLIKLLDESGVKYSPSKLEEKAMSTPDIADRATKYTVQVMCRG